MLLNHVHQCNSYWLARGMYIMIYVLYLHVNNSISINRITHHAHAKDDVQDRVFSFILYSQQT